MKSKITANSKKQKEKVTGKANIKEGDTCKGAVFIERKPALEGGITELLVFNFLLSTGYKGQVEKLK